MCFKTWFRTSLTRIPQKKAIVCKSLRKRMSVRKPEMIPNGDKLIRAKNLPSKSPLGYSTKLRLKGTQSISGLIGFLLSNNKLSWEAAIVLDYIYASYLLDMTPKGSLRPALTFKILAECSTSRARTSVMTVPHSEVETPVFMPVGTQGTLKGLLPEQLEAMDCRIILGNTYHLGNRPGPEVLRRAGGLHRFMGWRRALLTDSGGFQMVSLVELSQVTEEGVSFKSPYDSSELMLKPETSIEIQNAIGADIMMQLDDVVSTLTTGPRVEEAMHRTVRWVDRCLSSNERPEDQSIFPIVQGGLDPALRTECVNQLLKRDVNGYAIGGLSGGEAKDDFWRVVKLCSELLPRDKPRYCMGVGFATDLVVCVALGVDMFDCVFPTRTARFGCGLVDTGQINLKLKKYAHDYRPIQEDCECPTCKSYTRAYLNNIVTVEPVACNILTVHNVFYQLRLMKNMREAIKEGRFPAFVRAFMDKMYHGKETPQWIIEALQSVNIDLQQSQPPQDQQTPTS